MDSLFKTIARIAYTGYVPQDKLDAMLSDPKPKETGANDFPSTEWDADDSEAQEQPLTA